MKALTLVIILFGLLSCQQAPLNFEGNAPESDPAYLSVSAAPALRKQMQAADEEQTAEMISGRKLIKSGSLNVEVQQVSKTKEEIEKLCTKYDAYISSETQSNYPGRFEYSQVIRIPASHFDTFVSKVEGLGTRVESKNIETSDVTEEFIDKEARIKTKKELEQRYREILKRADDVADILSIEAQLNHVRADIESMEGRLTFLRNQVAFSTLTLSFYEPIGAESAFGAKTIAAFSRGWDGLLIFLIALVNIWPFLLLTAGVFYLTVRRMRERRRKEQPQTAD